MRRECWYQSGRKKREALGERGGCVHPVAEGDLPETSAGGGGRGRDPSSPRRGALTWSATQSHPLARGRERPGFRSHSSSVASSLQGEGTVSPSLRGTKSWSFCTR